MLILSWMIEEESRSEQHDDLQDNVDGIPSDDKECTNDGIRMNLQ